MSQDAFSLTLPLAARGPLVFSSPHSGRHYPPAFLAASQLDPLTLRSSEDAFVDDLFATAPQQGAPLLSARLPRAWLDLNRAPDEFDPALIDGIPRGAHNPRIASGLGVIPRVVAGGRAIYPGKLPLTEAEARIAGVWRPYHAALRRLVDGARAGFGEAVVIDCHSMPHEAIEAHARPGQPRPEVVLGDRFGAAAGAGVMDRVEAAFATSGLRVARNAPFAGAYITQAYGRPAQGVHVVQVEIDRALYLDEARVARRADFAAFAGVVAGIVAHLAEDFARPLPLAAE